MEVDCKSKEEATNWSTYKRAQVRCKQATLQEIHSLPGFVDFCYQGLQDGRIQRIDNPTSSQERLHSDSNKTNYYQGPIYGIVDYPGLLFMPQAISKSLQIALAFEAVTKFPETPHATNIDLVEPKKSEDVNLPHETMWSLWKSDNGFSSSSSSAASKQEEEEARHTRKNKKIGTNNRKKQYRSFRKLSWATTGYHYDWTERCYHEKAKSYMPVSLEKLATYFARTSLWIDRRTAAAAAAAKGQDGEQTVTTTTTTTSIDTTNFTPSASIVNYYNLKSVMGGHRDDLEYALDKPVVSISLGLPAIFLLGGKTKDCSPVLPILVRPGDVLILGGGVNGVRLNYHGMAKVLPPDFDDDVVVATTTTTTERRIPTSDKQVTLEMMSSWIDSGGSTASQEEISAVEWEICRMPESNDAEALSSFLTQHRININVRQVHKD